MAPLTCGDYSLDTTSNIARRNKMNTSASTPIADTKQRVRDHAFDTATSTGTLDNTVILHNGDMLYRMGDELKGIYLVNAVATVQSTLAADLLRPRRCEA